MVRAYARLIDSDPAATIANVEALLYGFGNGSPVPNSPIDPLQQGVAVRSSWNRSVFNDTINFLLPAGLARWRGRESARRPRHDRRDLGVE